MFLRFLSSEKLFSLGQDDKNTVGGIVPRRSAQELLHKLRCNDMHRPRENISRGKRAVFYQCMKH
mgnify:FL=1